MSVSPAREALNTPAAIPCPDVTYKGRPAACVFNDGFGAKRTPNYTGQGSHRFSAVFTVNPLDGGPTWHGTVWVYQMTPDGAAFPRFETTVYSNGRMLPESNLPAFREAALAAYLIAFPWADAVELGAWALRQGVKIHCDSAGTWGRMARADGAGFSYRGQVGDTRETLACLVEDIRAGAAAPAPAPVADVATMTWDELQAAKAAGNPAAIARIQAMKESPVLATSDGVRMAGTIDPTPSWRDVLPVYLAAYEGGTGKGRAAAIAELGRMADIADSAVASAKAAPAAVAWRTGSDVTLDPARAENWRAMGATVYPLADLPGKAV